MTTERYDILILGSGAGGKHLAWAMAGAGHRTAVVERRWIGGSCPNVNCLPSKNEIWSAKVADLVRHSADFGLVAGPYTTDMHRVRERKRAMVEAEVSAHLANYEASGAELVMGTGRFVAPKTIEVRLNDGGTRVLTGDRVFVNVGTHAAMPSIPGLAESQPLTNIELLELDRVPEHLVVLGAGYVGIEFAQAYRRFGSRVTVIAPGSQILPREDADVSDELRRILAAESVEVQLDTNPIQVDGRSGDEVSLRARTRGDQRTITATDVLVATGRTPSTADIGLDTAGVELDAHGYVKVDDHLATTAPGVWAIGECAGSPQFTHASVDDFRIIHDNLAGGRRSTRDRLIPFCLFTDPPLARVGLTEMEARQRGIAVRVAKIPMTAVLRTHTTGETAGFMKLLVEASGSRILGFTMVGADAGEVIAAVQTAMLGGLSYTVLRDAVFAHPTTAEGLNGLFGAVPAAARS